MASQSWRKFPEIKNFGYDQQIGWAIEILTTDIYRISNSYKTSVETTYLAWMNDERHVTVHVCRKLAECADHLVLNDVTIRATECVEAHHELEVVDHHMGNILDVDGMGHRLVEIQHAVQPYKVHVSQWSNYRKSYLTTIFY